jgi:PAS domain-containing protein
MTGSPLQDANRLRTLVSALFRREGAGRTARALFSHILISRFLLMVLFLFAALALFGLDQVSLYAFITLAFVVNIPFTLWLRDESKRQRLGPLQFVTDVIVITGVVHFTGGINSHFTLLYPLAILTAGVVESGRLALKVAVLSILLYSTLIVLETSGVLIYRGPEPFPYAGIDHVYQQLMVRILIFTFFAAASSYLADRCFYQNHQMQRLRLVVEFIFNNVSIALLAVGRDGKVLVANTAAQELFGMSGRDIQQRSFPDFFADRQVPDLASGRWSDRTARFSRRHSRPPFPDSPSLRQATRLSRTGSVSWSRSRT